MAKYSEQQRIDLARWLHTHAHRLSKRPVSHRHKTEAERQHSRARNMLWCAARELRRIEGGEK